MLCFRICLRSRQYDVLFLTMSLVQGVVGVGDGVIAVVVMFGGLAVVLVQFISSVPPQSSLPSQT
jgi:hypothetical protein